MEQKDVKRIKKLANKNAEAALVYARMNFEGEGIPRNQKEGIKYALKAAKKGNLAGYNFVGFCYANGYGVSEDKKKAAKFYQKGMAAEDGNAEYSLYVLAKSKDLGKKWYKKKDALYAKAEEKNNCYVDYNQAVTFNLECKELLMAQEATGRDLNMAKLKKAASVDLLKKAHKAGCEDATLALAVIYLRGDGVKSNIEKAKKLLDKIDEKKAPEMNYIYGYMYDLGLGVEQDHWKAYEYYVKAHKAGVEEATIAIALCELTGLGCVKNRLKAYNTFKAVSEEKKNALASYYLGLCLANGWGCSPNFQLAEEQFNKAADMGYAPALYELGRLCDVTVHKKNNRPDKCFDYYMQAAGAGNTDAIIGLATCYKEGLGVEIDEKKAYNLIVKAARQGNKSALYQLGDMYLNGTYVAEDGAEAIKFMEEAARRGDKTAIDFVCEAYTKGMFVTKDPVEAFEWKVKKAVYGTSKDYMTIAKAYDKGIKNVVKKDGQLAAYWYAKTTTEGEKKGDRQKAANKLKKYNRDVYGHWDLKKVVKKTNKKAAKLEKRNAKKGAPVQEESIAE